MREEIKLEPGRSLHLALEGPSVLTLAVYIRTMHDMAERDATGRDYVFEDVTARTRISFTPVGPPVAAAPPVAIAPPIAVWDPAAGTLTANTLGVRNLTIEVLDPPGRVVMRTRRDAARLTVHTTLNDWWLGNASLTVPRHDELAHGQVSIYAHFDGAAGFPDVIGEIADVTDHGFVDLVSQDPAVCEVSDARRGRLRGVAVGETEVVARFRGPDQRMAVHVVERYGTALDDGTIEPVPILERVAYRGPPSQRANLLFLAEGFTEADRPLFTEAVQQIVHDRMFRLPRHSPFPELAPDVNAWSAFVPSRERGFTYARRVSGADAGIAVAGASPLILQAVDSAYGIYLGWRPEDDNEQPDPHPPSYQTTLTGDPRRFPREVHWIRALTDQVSALGDPAIPAGDEEHHVGVHWANGGKDVGLVCILVNDFLFRAANYGTLMLVQINDGSRWTFTLTRPADRPHHWHVRRDDAPAVVRGLAGRIDGVTDTVVHEFAHSFGLGDEYEEDGGEHWSVDTATRLVDDPDVQGDNLIAPSDVCVEGPLPVLTAGQQVDIDAARVKWAVLHRVEKADRILEASWNVPDLAGISVTLTLEEDPTPRWEPLRAANLDVFLRDRPLVQTAVVVHEDEAPERRQWLQLPRRDEPPIRVFAGCRITEVRAADRQLVVSVPEVALPPSLRGASLDLLDILLPTSLQPGSVLYVPRRDAAGMPLSIVDALVTAYMLRTEQPLSANFAVGPGCAASDQGLPDYPPADEIVRGTAFRLPTHTFKVLGLYEGGDHASCRIYRPAGFCKMRSADDVTEWRPDAPVSGRQAAELCFACKYLIANRVNPRRLEEIDAKFPAIAVPAKKRR